MNSQKSLHMPSHVALKTIVQNNEIVCSPRLSENPNDISCVNADWITFVMVLCVSSLSANHLVNLPRKKLINATSKLIDPTLYIAFNVMIIHRYLFSNFDNAIYQSDI